MPTDHETDLLASLHSHLAATAERPIESETSRWLGEAQSIADDLRYADDLSPAALEERTETVASLLAEVDETGDETADEHVAAAHRCLDRLQSATSKP